MKISVIVPTYKPKEYIFKCLYSIKNQTLSSSLFEVLIILNGSKEPYFNEINNFIVINFNNAELIYSEERGVSNARNLGLDLANGENIVFLDDDDYISENYLENMLAYKTLNVSIVISNLISKSNECFYNDYYANAFIKLKDSKYNLLSFRKFLSSPCAKLIDRDTISNIRFDTELKTSEDALFCFEISRYINQMILADDSCIYYRVIRKNSASRRVESFMYLIRELFLKIKKISSIYFENPFSYNFIFYITRVLAFTKFLLLRIK